jgi:hypothetical protein
MGEQGKGRTGNAHKINGGKEKEGKRKERNDHYTKKGHLN